MVLHILLFISIAFPFVIAGSPDAKSVVTTKQSFFLRAPLNTPELRERQQEALKAIRSPIDAHLETEEMAVGGVTYMGDNGREVIHIFNPAPVFDFVLAKKIKDRYLENTPLSDSEGMLAASVYRVKQLLGEETESPKTIQELIEMADKGNISALVALELKGALFSIHNLRPGWTFGGWKEAKKAIYERFTSNSERKETLKLIRNLAVTLANNRIDSQYALQYSIPAIAKIAKNINELREALSSIENLVIKFADKGILYRHLLEYGIPAVAKIAKNINELREALSSMENVAITLANKGIAPGHDILHELYGYDVPIGAINISIAPEYSIVSNSEIIVAINKVIHSYFDGRYAESWEGSSYETSYSASKILEDVSRDNIPTNEIAKAIKFQKEYGNFTIIFMYTSPSFDPQVSQDISYVGSGGGVIESGFNAIIHKGWINEILIFPPDTTGANQAETRRGLRDQV